MGKILESIGVIDGYELVAIGKIRAKKDKWFEEIEQVDPKIKEETRKLVEDYSGRIFAIIKNNSIKGLYLFKVETKEDKKNLKHIKTVYVDEVSEKVREKYDEFVLNTAKEYVTYLEYDKVTLENEVVELDPKVSKNERIFSLISGFIIGFLLGKIITNDYTWGFFWGIIFAPLFSGLEAVVTKKRGPKKKK